MPDGCTRAADADSPLARCSQQPTSGVQLVVVSPLVRALETAAGIFGIDATEEEVAAAEARAQDAQQQQAAQQQQQQGQGQGQPGQQTPPSSRPASRGASGDEMETDPPEAAAAEAPVLLMRAQSKERHQRAAHGAVLARPGVKFVAVELCRERLGARGGHSLCRLRSEQCSRAGQLRARPPAPPLRPAAAC